MNKLVIPLALLSAACLPGFLFAQETEPPQKTTAAEERVPPLTSEEKSVLSRITPQEVAGILSFLASDEMKGRDTPSSELNIAAAYVASQFRAAGLEGLGPKGSFFLENELSARQLPGIGIIALDGKGNPIPHYGLVSATKEPYRWKGRLADADSPDGKDAKGAPLLLKAPGRRRGRMARTPTGYLVTQASSKARRHKASAILLRVPEDHPLIALAAKARKQALSLRTLAPSRGKRADPLPILLVPQDIQIEGPVRLVFPAYTEKKIKVRNVCAILRGSRPKQAKKAILFSAHLDHIGTGTAVDGDSVFNGADDDATGCTAVMLLARAYGSLAKRPAHSTIFMTFWGEEKGLLGSKHFVNNPAWPLEDILCNINIEMIGRATGERLKSSWVTGWTKTSLGALMAIGAQRVGLRIYRDRRLSAALYRGSDNWSFVQKGVIAHSFSASALHKDYHGRGDEWQKIDTKNMAHVIQGLFAGSLPIAKSFLIPTKGRR